MFHKINYNTIILERRAIKFLDLNFLYISKVHDFLDYILSLAKIKLVTKLNLKRLEPASR